MLSSLCPKVIVNIAIPVLMAASTLAQRLGMLNAFFRRLAQLALVIATVTGWLAQPTELLYGMVKHPLGCDSQLVFETMPPTSSSPLARLSTETVLWVLKMH